MNSDTRHLVIVGGGFAGLYTAKHLRQAEWRITLIDKRNFHLFQPLLYQVATGGISPGDIASPLRAVFSKQKNVTVLQAEATGLDVSRRRLRLRDGEISYDQLIVATGVRHHYFGHEEWAGAAPGLKTIEDALTMRRRIFLAFEAAERETDPARRRALMNFVVVGAGPTGVELAGALGELAHATLQGDFRHIDPHEVQIFLVEGQERILSSYPEQLSARAAQSLAQLGVTVRTNTFVTGVNEGVCQLQHDGATEQLPAATILWAAGVKASPLGQVLAEQTGCELDNAGRVKVRDDLSLPGHPEIFVIGDLAHCPGPDGQPLPGVAQVAMQQGKYVAEHLRGKKKGPFRYQDRGSLAVIGRNRAVANIFGYKLSGFLAWLVWVFIHIAYLIEFDNRLIVMIQWASDYFTRKRGARLITGDSPFPLIQTDHEVTDAT
ncbi:MAG: NAD(P)/FAD-dependent oxidoreductase [Anaerolineales bacterium]|nr:NAD(P)/FAD-dependent oxidoreductase [Anaerolineales bacterium]